MMLFPKATKPKRRFANLFSYRRLKRSYKAQQAQERVNLHDVALLIAALDARLDRIERQLAEIGPDRADPKAPKVSKTPEL